MAKDLGLAYRGGGTSSPAPFVRTPKLRVARPTALAGRAFFTPIVAGTLLAIGFGGELTATLTGVGGVAWRLGGLLLIAMAWNGRASDRSVLEFALIFSPWLLASAIGIAASLGGGVSLNALTDLPRQLFIVLIGATAYAAARGQSERRRLQTALLVAAVLIAAISAVSAWPMLKNGWSYAAMRATKNQLIETTGFGANSACFAGLVAAIGAYRSDRTARLSWVLVLVLVTLSVLLTARAPVAMLVIAALLALYSAGSGWQTFRTRADLAILVSALALLGLVGGFLYSIDAIAHSGLADELAGRGALWQIGMAGWSTRPIFGMGLHSYLDVIRDNLGDGFYTNTYERAALLSLQGGGFHNIWVNTLVERGIVGFAGLMASYGLLVARLLTNLSTINRRARFRAILLLTFIFLRGFVEIAGLMSFGDTSLDAIVILAVAITISPPLERRSRGHGRSRTAVGSG